MMPLRSAIFFVLRLFELKPNYRPPATPRAGFFGPKWPLGMPRGGGTSNPGPFGLDGDHGGTLGVFGFSSLGVYLS